MTFRSFVWLAVAALTAAPGLRAQCIWGSFDATRIEGAASVLSTGNYANFRAVITQNGGALGLSTRTLTKKYLDGVQVFYTSLLSRTNGALSANEAAAFRNWFDDGGTLIVTADIHSHAAYDSFTKWLGITGYSSSSSCRATGSVVRRHGATLGINSFFYCTIANFRLGGNAKLLGNDAAGKPFMAVVDPTGNSKGKMLVLGDHNLFTDWFINDAQNTELAAAITRWSCTKGCPNPAEWNNYGTGLAGRHGVPSLSLSDAPIIGSTVSILAANSSGLSTNGLLVIGFNTDSAPILGGSLLATLDIVLSVQVPDTGFSLPFRVPEIGCGLQMFLQLLQTDAAAAQTVSFTPGMRMAPGH